ncbi:MAG TPA: hypothetical protein VKU88_10620 [Acidimicrobiales bacterium]|nr:hypothetical protein [Acidimicrobiales bacterium]
MNTALIVVTIVEAALVVVVLAVYLIAIASVLRRVSATLGLITFGVRAIERQTEPIGPVVTDINTTLEEVAEALEAVVVPKTSSARPRT